MKHVVVFALCLGLAAAGSVTAGEMTSGLEMNGGQNAFAGLKLERVQDGTQKEGVFKASGVDEPDQGSEGLRICAPVRSGQVRVCRGQRGCR